MENNNNNTDNNAKGVSQEQEDNPNYVEEQPQPQPQPPPPPQSDVEEQPPHSPRQPSSRTPFTNLSQVDADLALARTLQEQVSLDLGFNSFLFPVTYICECLYEINLWF